MKLSNSILQESYSVVIPKKIVETFEKGIKKGKIHNYESFLETYIKHSNSYTFIGEENESNIHMSGLLCYAGIANQPINKYFKGCHLKIRDFENQAVWKINHPKFLLKAIIEENNDLILSIEFYIKDLPEDYIDSQITDEDDEDENEEGGYTVYT